MLSKLEKDYLIDLLEKGQNIPEDFKYKLFPVEHKEYELAYAGKMRKEDLLADDEMAPFQSLFKLKKSLMEKNIRLLTMDGKTLWFLETICSFSKQFIRMKT